MTKEDLMREAFRSAHEQLHDHMYKKIDYLQREKKDRSWKDKDHPTHLTPEQERSRKQQETRLKNLHDRHGWGGEKD